MKFRNVGQVLLALVVSVGLSFGVTSCTNSYTVGYMYVSRLAVQSDLRF